MRAAAEGDGIAENGLRASEPCGREMHAGDGDLGRFVKQGCADELGFGAQHAVRACFQDFLVLALAEAELPRHPLDLAVGRAEPLVNDAEQAQARHAVLVEDFARVVGGKGFGHAGDCRVAKSGWRVLRPGVQGSRRGCAGGRCGRGGRGRLAVEDAGVASLQEAAEAPRGGADGRHWRIQGGPGVLRDGLQECRQGV